MSLSKDQVSIKTPLSYQMQKLYIEELEINYSLDAYERDLKMFLSKYGTIIDIKILQNRKLKRAGKTLCLRYFRGR